jgi:hypothetical protein
MRVTSWHRRSVGGSVWLLVGTMDLLTESGGLLGPWGPSSPLEWLPLSVLTHLESERLQKVDSPSILGLELNLMVEYGTNGIYKRWTDVFWP